MVSQIDREGAGERRPTRDRKATGSRVGSELVKASREMAAHLRGSADAESYDLTDEPPGDKE
jgi:hypothetical protein